MKRKTVQTLSLLFPFIFMSVAITACTITIRDEEEKKRSEKQVSLAPVKHLERACDDEMGVCCYQLYGGTSCVKVK